MKTAELVPGKTVVVFIKTPPFNEELEGSLAIFDSPGLADNTIQFWIHKMYLLDGTETTNCTLCTVDAEYEILGEL